MCYQKCTGVTNHVKRGSGRRKGDEREEARELGWEILLRSEVRESQILER